MINDGYTELYPANDTMFNLVHSMFLRIKTQLGVKMATHGDGVPRSAFIENEASTVDLHVYMVSITR